MLRVRYAWLVLLISCNFLVLSFAQDFSDSKETLPYTINNPSTFNKTALQYFSVAQSKLIEQEWQSAYALADHATIYDDSIADLYYIMAISLYEQGAEYYRIIPLLEKSLDKTIAAWYSFNRDSARTMLARCYVMTKNAEGAIAILDAPSYLQTSDAMLIRANAFYVQKDVEKARMYVLEGASQHPFDLRFDELFYTYEYRNVSMERYDTFIEEDSEQAENPEIVLQEQGLGFYASFFNARQTQFSRTNSNLLLYSAIFTENNVEKHRLLQAWNAQGEKDPLYALYALKENILSEEQAFEYMLTFFNDISITMLVDFISLLSEETVIDNARKYFNNYEGIVHFDVDGDLINELIVYYERGRPSKISFDENQDGMLSWEMLNDYGAPQSIEFFEDDLYFDYSTWPFVHSVTNSSNETTFYLVEDTIAHKVIDFVEVDAFKSILSVSFYTPSILDEKEFLTMDLFNASYLVDTKVFEYDDSRVRYTVLDGIVKSAMYTQNEYPYAYFYFDNGVPISRNVDKDKNGSYEVLELYAQSDDKTLFSEQLFHEIFAFEHLAQGQYIQKVLVDLDNDGLDDFSEEYIEVGRTIAQWDSNNDGSWDVHFISDANSAQQEVQYIHPFTNEKSSILIEDGIPIQANGKIISLDDAFNFYWIGENVGSSYAEKIITELSLRESAVGLLVTDILWNSEKEQFMRIVGIKNGDMYFGEVYFE